MAVVTVFVVAWWRRSHGAHDRVLRVAAGELSVQTRRQARTQERVPERTQSRVQNRMRLDDLADVVLDTKAIERLLDGKNMIPALRGLDSRVAPATDVSCIMLVAEDGTESPIAEAYLAHMDATEWIAKIRLFLRRQGWVPEDERDPPESDAEPLSVPPPP